MRTNRILHLLARARMDLESAAMEVARCDDAFKEGKIGNEMAEVRARVDALEARVAVVEGNK